jgi:hypothetical protein
LSSGTAFRRCWLTRQSDDESVDAECLLGKDVRAGANTGTKRENSRRTRESSHSSQAVEALNIELNAPAKIDSYRRPSRRSSESSTVIAITTCNVVKRCLDAAMQRLRP